MLNPKDPQCRKGRPRPARPKVRSQNRPPLKRVERLIAAEDFASVGARARALVQRFSDDDAANRMLVDALDQAESGDTVTLAAYQWAQRRPNSQVA